MLRLQKGRNYGLKYSHARMTAIAFKLLPDQITMPPGAAVEPARRPAKLKAIAQQSLRLTRKA